MLRRGVFWDVSPFAMLVTNCLTSQRDLLQLISGKMASRKSLESGLDLIAFLYLTNEILL